MAIITISRGSFAGGKAVAEHLARRLGYPSLSREETLAQAARDYGLVADELAQALNESPPFWQQVPGKRLAYVKCVTAVLLEHACGDNLVYQGHVGHLLLAGISHVLRVRVIADLEYRVGAAMRQLQISRAEAMAHIQRVDEDRARWARFLYGVDWQDPAQYSVVLNLQHCGVESVSETLARMAELPEFQPTPESRKRFEDLRLSSQVWAAMARHPAVRSAGIEVTADNGAVWIRGTVGSSEALKLIPQVAGTVAGVQAVHNEAGLGTDWYW
jgi:cytidylate kinase